MLVAVIDRTTKKRFAAGQLPFICEGLTKSFAQHVPNGLGIEPWKMYFHPSGDLPAGVKLVMWMLDDADQPGAAGYHDENGNDIPESKIFVETCLDVGYSINGGPNSISVVMDHEFKEMAFDPTANAWLPMGNGSQVAAEVCDPVEEQAEPFILRGNKVWCSDFIYKSYFSTDPEVVGPFNWLGGVTKPFQILPGGYLIEMDSSGNVTQQFGDRFPDYKKSWKSREGSRFHKHMLALKNGAGAKHGAAEPKAPPAPPQTKRELPTPPVTPVPPIRSKSPSFPDGSEEGQGEQKSEQE